MTNQNQKVKTKNHNAVVGSSLRFEPKDFFNSYEEKFSSGYKPELTAE